MHHQQPFTSTSTAFVFPPETVVQTPVVINSDFTFTCPPHRRQYLRFHKEKYESAKSGCKRRRKSTRDEQCETSSMDGGDDVDDNVSTMSQVEFRRQIHIQSEQKRRAEIKDGFEELRRQLPTTYTGRKLSKAVLLQKAVSHMKNMLDEINRLTQTCVYLNAELEKEKRMGTLYRQKQTLDKIYAIGL
ncbi:unnamed protein product [Rhizophagus irregularis]|nr:unnamed protein product [Rhizophagus irregularis]